MIKIFNKHTSHIVPIKKSPSDISYLMPGQEISVNSLEEIKNFGSIKCFLTVSVPAVAPAPITEIKNNKKKK